MKRFLLWLCSRGYHRGSSIYYFNGTVIVDCYTCDTEVSRRWL